MIDQELFHGKDVQSIAKNLLGHQLNFPKSSFPVKEGIIIDVQWYDIEDKDPETTEDKQGDALMMTPGQIFLFESMGHTVLLISAVSEQTRACVRINGVHGVAEAPHLLTRALGFTSFNRQQYQGMNLLDSQNSLFLSEPTADYPEPETYTPRYSQFPKGLKLQIS